MQTSRIGPNTNDTLTNGNFDGSGSWGQRASGIAKTLGIMRRTLYCWSLCCYGVCICTGSLSLDGVPGTMTK
jgi:hypothetical protein